MRNTTRNGGTTKRAHVATGVALIAIAIGGSSIGTSAHAAASTVSATTFATNAEYCGSGQFALSGALKVVGGSAMFSSGGCDVAMSQGSKLSFKNAKLAGTDNFQVSGGAGAAISFNRSEVRMDNVIQLRPGYQAGDAGRVKIVKSTLAGLGTYISASAGYRNGKVTVDSSTIEATYNGSLLLIEADANGTAKVTKSTLTTDQGNVIIDTGLDGHTTAVKNRLSYKVATIRSDGTCVSQRNNPETPCKP